MVMHAETRDARSKMKAAQGCANGMASPSWCKHQIETWYDVSNSQAIIIQQERKKHVSEITVAQEDSRKDGLWPNEGLTHCVEQQ